MRSLARWCPSWAPVRGRRRNARNPPERGPPAPRSDMMCTRCGGPHLPRSRRTSRGGARSGSTTRPTERDHEGGVGVASRRRPSPAAINRASTWGHAGGRVRPRSSRARRHRTSAPRRARTCPPPRRAPSRAKAERGPDPNWGSEPVRPAVLLVGDTGIEPVTSSVSGKRATAAPIAQAADVPSGPSTPRWRRDSNPCTRLCRPLPRLSATPPLSVHRAGPTASERTTGFEPATLTLAR